MVALVIEQQMEVSMKKALVLGFATLTALASIAATPAFAKHDAGDSAGQHDRNDRDHHGKNHDNHGKNHK